MATTKIETWSAAEKAAMKERAKELKRAGDKEVNEKEVLLKIAAMAPQDRTLAENLHVLIKSTAPSLEAKTWYGMPAYALEGKTVLFFQDAGKFKARYATLGFSDQAKLDQGSLWPSSYAITQWNASVEKEIKALIKKALG